MGEPTRLLFKNDNTEKGYTEEMRKNILGKEREIRNNKDESLHVFSARGKLLLSLQGEGTNVYNKNGEKIPQNGIIVHNHPRSIGKSGIMRIGNSFSSTDMASAVRNNAKEMRAVTPTYTFSMKRPRGGWNATPQQVRDAYNKYDARTQDEFMRYLNKRGWSNSAVQRAQVLHWHRVNQLVAKEFGWNYTKKNK